MTLGDARALAGEWLAHHRDRLPGYAGAYFAGSSIALPPESELPTASDLDVMVILDTDVLSPKIGKFTYHGVLLEISMISRHAFVSLEHILCTHYLAYNLHRNTVIDDPGGWLSPLQKEIAAHYAKERWVQKRCMTIAEGIRKDVSSFHMQAPLYDQVTAWLFPTGKTTHVLLAAALQNCTVRLRYTQARKVLEAYGLADFYPELLMQLGGSQLSGLELSKHLDALADTFDLASQCASSGFPFASDISQDARCIAIEGSRALLSGQYPCEAIFWMAATFARCHKILDANAPEWHARRIGAFLEFLHVLGIQTLEDLHMKNQQLLSFLPRLEKVAQMIIAKNPQIQRETADT